MKASARSGKSIEGWHEHAGVVSGRGSGADQIHLTPFDWILAQIQMTYIAAHDGGIQWNVTKYHRNSV
jgi:hypothetical protein